jgi:hypothetical protein
LERSDVPKPFQTVEKLLWAFKKANRSTKNQQFRKPVSTEEIALGHFFNSLFSFRRTLPVDHLGQQFV